MKKKIKKEEEIKENGYGGFLDDSGDNYSCGDGEKCVVTVKEGV